MRLVPLLLALLLLGCGSEKASVVSRSMPFTAGEEQEIIQAVRQPVIKKTVEGTPPEDSLTRYSFLNDMPAFQLEFKHKSVNVFWLRIPDDKAYEDQNRAVVAMAKSAIAKITGGGDASEVEQAMAGETFRGKGLASGLIVRGSCSSSTCLLTYSNPNNG